MGLDYLWDTNTVIYYLQNQFPPNADAIIASSALANNLTLITRNVKDFERINKLKLSNPFNS